MLDTSRLFDYLAALVRHPLAGVIRVLCSSKTLVAVMVLSISSVASAAGESKVRGAILPGGSVRISEDRYRLPDGFDATVKWYKTVYKTDKYAYRQIINQPGIKAIHLENLNAKDEWAGLNLYEYQGQMRVFVVPRDNR